MAVMAREARSDKRLDDLNARVESIDGRMEAGFADVRQEFRAVRGEMATQNAMLNQTLYRLFGGMIVTWIVGVVAILTQV